MTDEPVEAMLPTKDRIGAYDAIESAKPGEFLFPLQAGDPFAPATVKHWAKLCRAAGEDERDPKKAEHLLRKATEAEEVAWAMDKYQRDDPEPTGGRARYADHAPLVLDETTASQRSEREARIKAVERITDIAGRTSEVIEFLNKAAACPAEAEALKIAMEQITALALAIEPQRGNERS